MKDLSIYIHIPFCKSKCSYCDFNSYSASPLEIDSYLHYLKKEIRHMSTLIKSYNIKSIFVGGGTPSILNEQQLERLLSIISKYIDFKSNTEFTVECNPDSITYNKLVLMKQNGINRLSIGLQSTVNTELKYLGRIHTYEQFVDSYKMAREALFDNISVDLMFAFPTQTIKSLDQSLEQIIKLTPNHISCYSLIVEDGTKLQQIIDSDKTLEIDDDTYVSMYELVTSKLHASGYSQYEISNFEKEGKCSTHNIGYWTHREYIGFGLGAHSYFKNHRFENKSSISDYQLALSSNKLPRENITKINTVDFLEEEVMLRIRMNDGIDLEYYWQLVKDAYPNISDDSLHKIKEKIDKMKTSNLLTPVNNKIQLTNKGRQVSNQVILDLIP